MAFKNSYLIFLALALLLSAEIAVADSKILYGAMWPPEHWRDQDFVPYYENGTDPHMGQWNKEELAKQNWNPSQWVSWNKGDGLGLIQRWYNADILRDQKISGGVPTLVVGPNFYHLSGADKRKIIETIDYVYGVTNGKPKMFYLEDWATKKHIGFYSKDGLVLQ